MLNVPFSLAHTKSHKTPSKNNKNKFSTRNHKVENLLKLSASNVMRQQYTYSSHLNFKDP